MKKEYILSLDLGTTGNRAIVFDKKQNIIASSYREFAQIFPKPGWVEHNPDEIFKSTLSVIKDVLKRVDARKIAGVGITNQRETTVVWDRKTHKPLYNAIVWQCRRTADICSALKKRGLEDFIHQRTGLFLDPYFSATKIIWLLKNIDGLKKRAKNGDALFGTIDSWILYKLTAGKSHLTDASNASRTMLFNLKKLDWDRELLRLFDVPERMLPSILDSSAIFGKIDKKYAGITLPVYSLVGDQQGAAFAQGCFEKGIVKNTYGTGLFILMNTGRQIHLSKNLLTTVLWSLNGKAEYAIEGSVFTGGAAIQWLRDKLAIVNEASDTEALARSLHSNDGVYFVPALAGLGAPYWDPGARGLIIGITRGTTRAHIARAALEAIAYSTKDVVDVIVRELGARIKKLQVDGGASKNNFLMQFQADMLGVAVERPAIVETTALGACGLAGIKAGLWRDRKEFISLRKVDRVFKPRMYRPESIKLYRRWKEAVKKALGWEHL